MNISKDNLFWPGINFKLCSSILNDVPYGYNLHIIEKKYIVDEIDDAHILIFIGIQDQVVFESKCRQGLCRINFVDIKAANPVI